MLYIFAVADNSGSCHGILTTLCLSVMSLSSSQSHFPDTPRSSRCGNVRDQKRIHPHPVSILRCSCDLQVLSSDDDDLEEEEQRQQQQDEAQSPLYLTDSHVMFVNICMDSVASSDDRAN